MSDGGSVALTGSADGSLWAAGRFQRVWRQDHQITLIAARTLAVSRSGIFAGRDRGGPWQRMPMPATEGEAPELETLDGRARRARSTDGQRWEQIPMPFAPALGTDAIVYAFSSCAPSSSVMATGSGDNTVSAAA